MSKRSNSWTQEQDMFLQNNYPEMGALWCHKEMDRTYYSVKNRARKLNLVRDSNNPQKQYDKFVTALKENNYTPLFGIENWTLVSKKYPVRCHCGHEWKCLAISLLHSNAGCRKCAGSLPKKRRDYLELAKSLGGEWIASSIPKNTTKNTEWKCVNGHTVILSYGRIKDRGRITCSECCPAFVGQKMTQFFLEELTGLSFETQFVDFIRHKTGRKLQLDGYNEDSKLAFEYNGPMHYSKVGYNTSKILETIKKRDIFKKKKCLENGVALLIIDETGGQFNKNSIRQSVIDFIEQNSIPMVKDPNQVDIQVSDILAKNPFLRVKEHAKKLNLAPISQEYEGCNTKLNFSCNDCKKTIEMSPSRLRVIFESGNGRACTFCSGHRKLTIDSMNALISVYGFVIPHQAYKNNETKLQIIFPDGTSKKMGWNCFSRYWFPKLTGRNINGQP